MKKIGTQTTSTRPTQQKAKTADVNKKTDAGKSQAKETAKHGKESSVEKSKDGREVKDSRDSRESQKGDGTHRSEDKAELSKEAREGEKLSDEDKSELAELLKKLSENLEEGSKEPDKRIEDKGGACCGRPKQPDKIVPGKTDWNQLLTADILAVRAQQLTGGRSAPHGQDGKGAVPGVQGAQQNGQAQGNANQARPNGGNVPAGGQAAAGPARPSGGNAATGGLAAANQAKPGAGNAAAGGQAQPQDPLSKLSADYSRAKSSGAQLDERIENEVKQLLGIADNGPQGQGAQLANGALGS